MYCTPTYNVSFAASQHPKKAHFLVYVKNFIVESNQTALQAPIDKTTLTSAGIEPATFCSEDRCSAIEPRDRAVGYKEF
jgi:hypothetical protein